MRVNRDRLIRFLNPRSIAVFGGREAEQVLIQCQKLRFQGKMWAVNPKRDSMAGISCLAGCHLLPETPDAVFIGVPAEPTIRTVEQLNHLGAGGAVCLASGFSEVGDEGGTRQHRLRKAAGDMPVLGPNCYGYVNTLLGAAMFPDQHGLYPTDQGVAIITSSGNIGINFTLQQRGLPISWLVTTGNQAVIGIEEVMAAALENEKIKAIGLHIEGLRDLPLFVELAARARDRGVPVIVLKTGKSDLGARITFSHTATLAGENGLYTALFDRLGIGIAGNIETFLEALKLGLVVGPLTGNRIASMSCSGGEASLIADLSVGRELVFPRIEADHRMRLRKTLNDYVAIHNPLDYHTFIWGDRQRMTATFSAMMSGNYNLTLLLIDFPLVNDCVIDDWLEAARAFVAACQQTGCKGAVVTCLSENLNSEIRSWLIENGVAPLHGMEQALAAIETVSKIGMGWSGHWSMPTVPDLSTQAYSDRTRSMNENQAKQFLKSHGIAAPDSITASATDEVREAAMKIGYPLVLKAVSSFIAHKSEAGAVVVGIGDEKTLNDQSARLFGLSDTLLVEQMVTDSVAELLIGVSYDPVFGHYLILGFGGILVELIKDREILLFPVDRAAIIAALERLKTWPLLNGFRNRALADVEAVVDTVMAVAELIESRRDEIVELEINPLMVRPQHHGAVVADALIRVRS